MKWVTVAVLWGVAALNYVDRQVVFSILPLLERDLHASAFELGLISTVFLWAYGLVSPFGGFLADRLGRARVILASLAVWTLATWLTGHVSSMAGLLWARGLMGVSEAFYLPAALALIAEEHGDDTRSLATGLHQSGLYTGIVLGGAWGGWMGENAGWRPIFSILGIAGVIYLLIAVATLRRRRVVVETPRADLGGALTALFRKPGFLALTAAFTTFSVANWMIYTWLPLFLFERFHLGLSNAGFSATFYIQAASYAGVVAGGTLTDRWARKNPQLRVWGLMAGLAAAAPFLAVLGMTGSMFVLIAALIAVGLGRGLVDCNAMPVLHRVVGAELSATGYGVFNLAGCVVGGIGAAAAGFMKESVGLGAAFLLTAVVLAIGSLCLRWVRMPAAG
ncbi:MAG TPA: MFS transporter [Bryobacteraceae bacterium]|jgi:MFS family permease|nr:MFS transporter [Bryobacteraceae bacterium]